MAFETLQQSPPVEYSRNSAFKQDLLSREIKGLSEHCQGLEGRLQRISTASKADKSTATTINTHSDVKIPSRFLTPPTYPSLTPQHPLYKTTSSSYGSQPPTEFEIPKVFYGMSSKFSKKNTVTYRNFGLNN